MNIFFLTLIVFLIIYFFLTWFAKSSSKKIYSFLRKSIIYIAIIFALIIAATGKYIFSLPFLLGVLPLIKTKAGITLLQLLRLWGFLRILKNSGRFNFGNPGSSLNSQPISRDEAYKILNLDPNKKYNKEDIQKSYKKIMKKIHPDLNPELNRLAAIVNESKEIVLKDII
ncbi:DnaJ domain-containing protein [Pelagibacterales bacterium SAG-MED22]|nr:DnaJ domain-containing protein [Pelagibacterales bacterium SAG-MED22]